MNWRKIEKKYLKACKLLNLWEDNFPNIKHFDNRYLYDFFDKQEIYIAVHSGITNLEPRQLRWMWEIHKELRVERVSYNPCRFNTRKEAEQVAFLKAFEILENKL